MKTSDTVLPHGMMDGVRATRVAVMIRAEAVIVAEAVTVVEETDMKPTLILLRGVQGSGKTTFARLIASLCSPPAPCFAADDYFYDATGEYKFDVTKLGIAHKQCLTSTIAAMDVATPVVVVHNTFSRASELTPYMKAAEERGYQTIVSVVENRHGNKDVHSVPQEVRDEFAVRIKNSLKLV